MANVYGVKYTLELAGIKSSDHLGVERSGKERFLLDTYEASALAIGQTIGIGKLKAGEVLLDAAITVDALGASSTLSLGDAGSATRYMAAFSTVSAGCNRIMAAGGVGYKVTADTELILTVAGGAITGTVKALVKIGNAQ